jgi:hypothetical protein
VICEEERQNVPPRGQTWTTLQVLFREYEKDVIGIGSTPPFAIGQRCSCARTTAISCGIASLTRDDATLTMIEGLGGINAIAISNPIFTRRWVERARAFTAPIHLLPRTSNGSCGPIQLSSFGTVRRKHSGTSSLWYATAVT